ncbi:hypothetical protein HDV00_008863 [Rhizophlyctis rosea]|nr:hypothetical protein HDV00_008863 [Rhizophlyctis rosea]
MEERDLEEGQHAEDLAASSLNVAAYVEVQSMERQAVESHLESLLAMKAFWSFLTQDQFDAAALPAYLDLMHRTQDTAHKFYEKLVARYPRSKNTLRMYAKYLIVVANNPETGQELLMRADEIEAQEERDVRERAVVTTLTERPTMPKEEKDALQTEARRPSVQFPPAVPDGIPEMPENGNESTTFHRSATTDACGQPMGMEHQMSNLTDGSSIAEWLARARQAEASKASKIAQAPHANAVDFRRKAKSVTSTSTSRKEFRRLKARQLRLKENLLAPVTKFSIYVRLGNMFGYFGASDSKLFGIVIVVLRPKYLTWRNLGCDSGTAVFRCDCSSGPAKCSTMLKMEIKSFGTTTGSE